MKTLKIYADKMNAKKNIRAAVSILSILFIISAGLAGCTDSGEGNVEPEAEVPPLFREFETVDLNGNTVTNDIFAQNSLTMVNVWTTWCPYCLQEMPALNKLKNSYSDAGFGVVGVLYDGVNYLSLERDEVKIETAIEIVDELGVEYPNILPEKANWEVVFGDISSFPTTFFVDREGRLVGEVYLGADSYKGWEKVVKQLLAQVGEDDEDEQK